MNTSSPLYSNSLRVTYKQTCEALKLSREGLRKLILRDDSFPRPIKMGESKRAAVYFDRKELLEWHNACLERR